MPTETKLEERPVWHKPQLQRVKVSQNTAEPSIKTGSTEDFFTQANDWPAGLPFKS